MYNHILIATDGSDLAGKAIAQGLALAKQIKARVTIVTATADWSVSEMADLAERGATEPVQEYERKAATLAEKVLAKAADAAKAADVAATTHHAKDKAPADGIVETARAKGCDLIVMSSHGRGGIGRMLLGSVASKVVMLSPIPVLVCR
jgi:nucleotide-binding universal stress UspA family protein